MGRQRSNHTGAKLAVAGAAALVMASGAHGHHHHHSLLGVLDSMQAAPVPAGASHSRVAWARTFLRDIPEPRTACNVGAVVAWETAEGGGFGNQAENNPLNVNPGPGAPWPGYNATGAWAFPTTGDGLKYTVQTIRNGNYGGILAALSAGNNAQAVADAIMASPWAASHYGGGLTARLLTVRQANPKGPSPMHPDFFRAVAELARHHHHNVVRQVQHQGQQLVAHVTQGAVTPKEGSYIAAALFVLALFVVVKFVGHSRSRGRS